MTQPPAFEPADEPERCESDLQIAGDILQVAHLLAPEPQHPTTVAEFVGLADTIAADRSEWEHLVEYRPADGWRRRLRKGPGYGIWLVSWVPGGRGGWHRHTNTCGMVTVIEGELTERGEGPNRVLSAGARQVFAPGLAHEFFNDTLNTALSLHAYHVVR